MRQAIEISNTLYQCRDQQIFLSGEAGFLKIFDQWYPVVKTAMDKLQCSEIQALIKLLELASAKNDGMMMHVLNAVVCEMCEPTVTKNREE